MGLILPLVQPQAVAVKITSEELFRAVSQESWTTPMMKPMPTTCMAMSLEIPKMEQARGISIREPPATPELPQAQNTAATHIRKAAPKLTFTPRVFTAAIVMITMVTAAPDILMVQPRGMDTEYVSRGMPRRLQRWRLMGRLAAEERVKKAYSPLWTVQVQTRGYGFLRVMRKTRSGLMTKAMKSMVTTRTTTTCR